MPLGNYTSQFFANVYLNELDYFVKHKLKAKYYIRYVDDFVIFHENKRKLIEYKEKINIFLKESLELGLHPDKSKITPLRNGISFLGYRIFFHHKLLRKRNKRKFMKKFDDYLEYYKEEIISEGEFISILKGWFGYCMWANTYNFRKSLLDEVNKIRPFKLKKPK